jgi:hypothetical protein
MAPRVVPHESSYSLRLFLRVVEQRLRARIPGSGPTARIGAVAFIHRFGSTQNTNLPFHCVVIEGVFGSAASRRLTRPADGSKHVERSNSRRNFLVGDCCS